MTQPDPAADLAVEFLALNDYLHGSGDQQAARQRLVELASTAVSGCEWAAITSWPAGREPRTLVSTGEVAQAVDDLQYRLGDGPCLTASGDDAPVWAPDLAAETRWPSFCAATQAETPVRGVLSFHLADEPHRGALNLYADEPDAFDAQAVNTGALFATHARVLMIHAAAANQAHHLTQALSSSRQIGAAVGILMAAHKVTADDAFEMLRHTSQHLNRKLRDIADDVTQTGQLPDQNSSGRNRPR